MGRLDNLASDVTKSTVECIEIRLWEMYLMSSRRNLSALLTSYSLDNGPYAPGATQHGSTAFRFTAYDWERSITQVLCDNHIPFEVAGKFLMDTQLRSLRSVKKKIYVAEDDLNILFALNTMLEEAGYDVLLSHCGQPMLEPKLPATDVFILDRRMPGVDGIEVCRHLRSQVETKNIPVIMISASRNAAKEAYEAGVNEFLEKPFQMKELLRLIAKHTSPTTQGSPHVSLY